MLSARRTRIDELYVVLDVKVVAPVTDLQAHKTLGVSTSACHSDAPDADLLRTSTALLSFLALTKGASYL